MTITVVMRKCDHTFGQRLQRKRDALFDLAEYRPHLGQQGVMQA
jgi:hypothetical protein